MQSLEAPPQVAEPVLVEWFNDHYYKVVQNGETRFLPSVTTKLGIIDKPNLSRWRGDIGNREADLRMYEAGQRGKRIHWAYEIALKGGAVVYDPWQTPVYTEEGIAELRKQYGTVSILRTQEEMWAVTKLQREFDILKPQVIGVEEKVYDLETNDAGTIDNVFWIDKGEYMIAGAKPLVLPTGVYIRDLKTGSDIHDEAWYQTAKYLAMWEKSHGAKCAGSMIAHTNAKTKKGIPGFCTSFHPREEVMDRDLPMYHKIAAVWEGVHAGEEPQQFQFPALITLKQNQKGETTK